MGRAALLAVAFAVLPMLDRRSLTTDEWLAVGLGFALAGVIGPRRRRAGAGARARHAADVDRPAGCARDRQRGAGGRRAHRARRGVRRRPCRRADRARRVHVRGLPRLPGARAGGQRLRTRPADRRPGSSTRSRTPAPGRSPTSPAARSRSPWAATGPCSPRARSTRARSSSPCWRPPSAGGSSATVPKDAAGRAADVLAAGTSRRGFLSRVAGGVMAVAGARTAGSLVKPGEAEAYHFCGHIYTTDSARTRPGCRASTRRAARSRAEEPRSTTWAAIDPQGLPIDEQGKPLLDTDGRRLPPAPHAGMPAVARRYGFDMQSTAPGTAAATATCASSSTAAPTATSGSTATAH